MTPPNPLPCGCRAVYEIHPASTGTSIHVAQCPLHETAAELLAALERIVKIRKPCSDPSADAIAMGYETEHIPECCRWCKARAAIAKARPQSSPGESESGGG